MFWYAFQNLFLLAAAVNLPNIFDETPACTFTLRNKTYTLTGKPATIKKFGFHVIFSPCVPIKSERGCDRNALVCMLGSEGVSNAGTAFDLVEDENAVGEVMLRSRGGIACRSDPERQFVTHVHFERKSSIEPEFKDADKCNLHMIMSHPDYEPPCTKRINGYLLDMRQLSGEIRVPTKSGQVALNLCGFAPACNNPVASSCILKDNWMEVLGTFDSHTVNYDFKTRLVEITYKIGSKQERLDVKVSVKCNWNVLKANLKYIEPPTQGKRYQFSVESYLGCVKMPMDCSVKGMDNFRYNLTGLYKPGGWKVTNVANGELVLNMCGPLKSSGICAENFSQICHKTDAYKNYGSILSNLQVENDVVSATLSDGSVCPNDASATLSANLKFKCSFVEKGPVLKSTHKCSYDLWWETPTVCPYYSTLGKGMHIVDNLGDRNLSGLCDADDRQHRLNSTSYLRYNFCRGLVGKCGSYSSNVSVCLHVQGKEFVIGFTNVNINSFNGMLSMRLYGENCPRLKEKRSFVVNFKCDYAANIIGNVDTIRDFCAYSMTITSPAVCPGHTTQTNCVASNSTHRFNLTKLSRTNDNYFVNVGGLDYSINVCRPIVVSSEAACRSNTAVCLRNRTEPNLKYRFSSLGLHNVWGNLEVRDGRLQLHYKFGKLCENGDDASTVIHFSCSENMGDPVFLKRTGCAFEFTWSSKHACPQKIKVPRSTSECILRDNNGSLFNLSKTRVRTFYVDGNHKYLFDICKSNYTIFDNNGVPLEIRSKVILDSNSRYLEFNLNNTCNETDDYNKVHVHFTCGQIEEFNMIGKSNCTVNVKYSANVFCSETNKENDVHPNEHFPKPKEDKVGEFADKVVKSIIQAGEVLLKLDRNQTLEHVSYDVYAPEAKANIPLDEFVRCIIKYEGFEIKLNDIAPFEMASDENNLKYAVGINGSSQCPGYVCKDGVQIATLAKCPEVEYTGAVIKAIFPFDGESERSYAVEMFFSCKTHDERPAIMKETEHTLTFSYPLEDICSEGDTLNVGVIIGVTMGVILLLVLIVVIVLRRQSLCTRYSNIRGNKGSVYVYCKDTDC